MKPRSVDWTKFSYLVQRAIASGAIPTSTSIEWDVSMGCERPFYTAFQSAPPADAISPIGSIADGAIRFATLANPCRKCPACLKARARLWRVRAQREIRMAPRTWFCTYTISPEWRFIFSARSGSRDFLDAHREISKEVTKYFKRLRKAGFKFRYLLVAEAHKDGYPHLHALIHEGATRIPKSRLQSEWPFGFTTIKLVETADSAYYVTKYVAKDARTRIRASEHYGQSVPDIYIRLPHPSSKA